MSRNDHEENQENHENNNVIRLNVIRLMDHQMSHIQDSTGLTYDEVMHILNEEDHTRPHRCMNATINYINGEGKIVYEEVYNASHSLSLGWAWCFYAGNGRYYYRSAMQIIEFCPWCGEQLDVGEYENFAELENPTKGTYRKSKYELIKDIISYHNDDTEVYLDVALDEIWCLHGLEAILTEFSYEFLEELLDLMTEHAKYEER
jgi:hypothetical protein